MSPSLFGKVVIHVGTFPSLGPGYRRVYGLCLFVGCPQGLVSREFGSVRRFTVLVSLNVRVRVGSWGSSSTLPRTRGMLRVFSEYQ